jgi:hypothetical protein
MQAQLDFGEDRSGGWFASNDASGRSGVSTPVLWETGC